MIAAYVRVSTDDQTTALQRDEIARWLELHRIAEPPDWYADEGVSGAKRSRPALDAMMREVRRRRVRRVIVYKLDRLGRDVSHLLGVLEEFREHEVVLVSITEGFDTGTPVGRLLYALIAALAEFERAQTRERITAGIQAARARGHRIGRPSPLMPGQIERAVAEVRAGASKSAIARKYRIARSTLRAYLAKTPPPEAPRRAAKMAGSP